jgi:hypothetical protein
MPYIGFTPSAVELWAAFYDPAKENKISYKRICFLGINAEGYTKPFCYKMNYGVIDAGNDPYYLGTTDNCFNLEFEKTLQKDIQEITEEAKELARSKWSDYHEFDFENVCCAYGPDAPVHKRPY